jgi:hypothetical protein
MMTKSGATLAIAWITAAAVAVGPTAGCGDTPPVSPSSAGVPAIASAHPSPDPPPGRPVIVEDAGGGASRLDAGAGAIELGGGLGGMDGGATGAVDRGSGSAGPNGGALSSAWLSTASGADAKVAALRPKFRACYTRGIKGRPQGRVVLHASVAADGSVLAVTAGENQGVAGRVVACMVDVLKGARLPAPGRATTLDVPIAFPAP